MIETESSSQRRQHDHALEGPVEAGVVGQVPHVVGEPALAEFPEHGREEGPDERVPRLEPTRRGTKR